MKRSLGLDVLTRGCLGVKCRQPHYEEKLSSGRKTLERYESKHARRREQRLRTSISSVARLFSADSLSMLLAGLHR